MVIEADGNVQTGQDLISYLFLSVVASQSSDAVLCCGIVAVGWLEEARMQQQQQQQQGDLSLLLLLSLSSGTRVAARIGYNMHLVVVSDINAGQSCESSCPSPGRPW